ncbi:MAG: alpha-xylosidase [Akkermansiaceae bacterium]|nr:alpha-xylosidase [Akkermansiaceae bacterium]
MGKSFTHVPEGFHLRIPLPPVAVDIVDGEALLRIPFAAYTGAKGLVRDAAVPPVTRTLRVRTYGKDIIRISFDPAGREEETTDMLTPETIPELLPLSAETSGTCIELYDSQGVKRARFNTAPIATRPWSDLLPAGEKLLEAEWFPDGGTSVPLASYDRFAHGVIDSVSLGYLEKEGGIQHTLFSFKADAGECFAGTGERFAKMDLSGRTLTLENDDGLGVNSQRTYKNIPFYLSSRPYGLFVHSSCRMHFSLAGQSTRAAQGLVEDASLDLFLCGGGDVPTVLHNYCRLTGFAPSLPRWSYGIWMSRMTYHSAQEVENIGRRLRDSDFPCDVLHVDTGWFPRDWICEWRFSPDRFPEPAKWMAGMREQGYRITLWQTPDISEKSDVAGTARENGYLPRVNAGGDAGSDFSRQGIVGPIDFSNPEAASWYQDGLLRPLLDMGAAAIKTDFGENIPMDAQYHGLPPAKLRNRYALLYQKAAFEVTEDVYGKGGSLIWARAGWAGCQRYPVHWSGDAECSWQGMAGALRGGLHLGLSGFTCWSHDVPGFHGSPDFMNSWPSDTLYVRWTQFGVFTSHMRYHGCSPREPYEYPAIADLVRDWWKLRYALIPYIEQQVEKSAALGLPMLRPMILADETDPTCWHLDDQYLFGEDFLVAPVMNDEGVRDLYLPAGKWINFWTGELLSGGRWLKKVESPLLHLPVFVRRGAVIPIYPDHVNCTDEMDPGRVTEVEIREGFEGLPVCPGLWTA